MFCYYFTCLGIISYYKITNERIGSNNHSGFLEEKKSPDTIHSAGRKASVSDDKEVLVDQVRVL